MSGLPDALLLVLLYAGVGAAISGFVMIGAFCTLGSAMILKAIWNGLTRGYWDT